VTAKFNLNILRRINREFSADFDLSRFRHRAIYNDAAGRIEMYLDSTCDHVVNIAGQKIELVTDEAILTEHSHKYTLEGFAEMVCSAGFSVRNIWSDPDEKFSVFYCLYD